MSNSATKKEKKKKKQKKTDYDIDISEGEIKVIFGYIKVPKDMTYYQFIMIKLHLQKFEDQEQREARRRRQNRIPLTPEEKSIRAKVNWRRLKHHVAQMRYVPNYLVIRRTIMLEAGIEAVNGINTADEFVEDNSSRKKNTGTEVMEKKWYHNIIVNPESSSWIGFWRGLIYVCYFYGYYRDIYYVAFHIARNSTYNENFQIGEPADMSREQLIDILLTINIVVQALTSFRLPDLSWEMNPLNLASKYAKEAFLKDALAVLPTLMTGSSHQLYIFKLIRFNRIVDVYDAISDVNMMILLNFMYKSVALKVNNIFNMLLYMFQSIHFLGCLWISLAKLAVCSWVEQGQRPDNPNCDQGSAVDQNDEFSLYVTAVYWVITTLTTVGYGDFKGYTVVEYYFQMVVEFLGIGVFSWLMGSINGMVASDCDLQIIIDERNEKVEEWLHKLQKCREKKILDRTLFKAILMYTEKSYQYDFSNLKDSEFYAQQKPRIRHRLINTLMANFISNFFYLFNDRDFEAGVEFTCEFVTSLKPQIFLPDNVIVDYGETFEYLYLIQESCVSLSLKADKIDMYKKLHFKDVSVQYEVKVKVLVKDSDGQEREQVITEVRERIEEQCVEFPPSGKNRMAEFLILPTFSYFGDYQIFGNHKSQVRFKATDGDLSKILMTLTITKERFLTLMSYFPEARIYYKPKAEARRIEFKRLMRNYYKKLEQNCFLDFFQDKSMRIGKVQTQGNQSSSDEEGISIEELLIRAANPDLKKFEKNQKRQSYQEHVISKKLSKFYDADCMPDLDQEIRLQDFDTDELIELSDDEKPEDFTDLQPDDKHLANTQKVDSIHNTMDTVIDMYKEITDSLNENSQRVNDFLEDMESKKSQEKIQPPTLMKLEYAILALTEEVDQRVQHAKQLYQNMDEYEQEQDNSNSLSGE